MMRINFFKYSYLLVCIEQKAFLWGSSKEMEEYRYLLPYSCEKDFPLCSFASQREPHLPRINIYGFKIFGSCVQ